jgi:hypothetical protein
MYPMLDFTRAGLRMLIFTTSFLFAAVFVGLDYLLALLVPCAKVIRRTVPLLSRVKDIVA